MYVYSPPPNPHPANCAAAIGENSEPDGMYSGGVEEEGWRRDGPAYSCARARHTERKYIAQRCGISSSARITKMFFIVYKMGSILINNRNIYEHVLRLWHVSGNAVSVSFKVKNIKSSALRSRTLDPVLNTAKITYFQ